MSPVRPATAVVPTAATEARLAAVARDRLLPDVDWSVPPEGSERWTFAAPSGPLAALRSGPRSGADVVLVPGVTGSKEDFRYQLGDLADAGYHVQSFDLAGQYESWPAGPERLSPPRARFDYPLFVEDLIAFLEAGGTGPAHLLGYSFAGVVAALVAVRRPDLVRSLTLLSMPPLAGQAFRGVRRVGALSRIAPPAVLAAAMKRGILANTQHVLPGRQRFVEHRFTLTRPAGFRQVMGLMRHIPDVRDRLRTAPFPIAVAAGTRDLWPLRLHRRLAADLDAVLLTYATGHSPCETTPHQLSHDLLAFFAAAAATTAPQHCSPGSARTVA